MKDGFRQSMALVHTWAGLAVGWVLFFMFLTGTAGYFDVEIDRWMQPERPLRQVAVPAGEAVAVAHRYLDSVSPDATRWFIGLPGRRGEDLTLVWSGAGAGGRIALDPVTGQPARHRDTGGGQFLYKLHYRLHYMPLTAAYWIVGACSMIMFVAIVSGVIIHRRIFRDFFTLRLRLGQRSWLDAHNVLGVMALPFHAMIVYSGLVFLAYIVMEPVIWARYGPGLDARSAYLDELSGRVDIPERSGVPAPMVPLGTLVSAAEQCLGAGGAIFVEVYGPGDANAYVAVAGSPLTPCRSGRKLWFDGFDGSPMFAFAETSVLAATRQSLLALHEGLFAGPALRWLYGLSGLMGTAMIATGLLLWTAKRRPRIRATPSFRLVERLNIATVVGLPAAVAGYFWANRLIPVGIAERAAWEAHAMFAVWVVLLAHAFLRPVARGWSEQLWIASVAFGLLPLVNALTTERHLGITLPAGAWHLAGIDLAMAAFGLLFGLVALGRRRMAAVPARAP